MIALSPTVHEATIKRHMIDDTDDPVLQSLFDAVQKTREHATKAAATTEIVLKNTMRTEAARHKDARAANFALLQRATKSLDDAVKAAQAEIAAIRKKTKGPTPAKDIVAETKQREMRERLSILAEDRRKSIITNAIKNNDETLVAAVLNCDAWLSGLTDAELALHRNNWATKNFRADLDRVERLDKAVAAANSAGSVALHFVDGLTNSNLVDEADAMEKQANAALAAVR